MMETEDRDLTDRLRAGDESALAEVLDRHWHGLLRYAYGLLGDWDRAEDVTQGAYVRLWASRDRWTQGSVIALLHTIVRNAAIDVLKSPRVRSADASLVGLAASGSPESATELAELESAVEGAVEALPPRRREVFRLVRESGLSYAEVAEVTKLSRQTVANHMSLALRDLRTMLRDHLPAGRQDDRDQDGRVEDERDRVARGKYDRDGAAPGNSEGQG